MSETDNCCKECMELPLYEICKKCQIETQKDFVRNNVENNTSSAIDICYGCVKIVIHHRRDRLMHCCRVCNLEYCDGCFSKFFKKTSTSNDIISNYYQVCDNCWKDDIIHE